MNRPRLLRALRITWTAFWGVAAVMVCVLWVRSHWVCDIIDKVEPNGLTKILGSDDGKLWCARFVPLTASPRHGWQHRIQNANTVNETFRFHLSGNLVLTFPDWFGIAVGILLGIVPWLHKLRRFSLRTLLVAMTLIAVGMGLIVWAVR